MAFGKDKKKDELVNALAELQAVDYSQNPKMQEVYERLVKSKDSYAEVLQKNLAAMMQISSLDMKFGHYIDKLTDITASVSSATQSISGSASDTADVATSISGQHEELTNTIIAASEESGNVSKKIEDGQEELTAIRELSMTTIEAADEMRQDMAELLDVVNHMNEVIDGINAISSQTNLLSLNASIEAARAGEAGRGFAVVADEIRGLAEETQNLTANMGDFVNGVKEASQKSAKSSDTTINALTTMTEKIGSVWEINEENQKNVAQITEQISSLAAVSEEISSSMMELEAQSAEIQEQCAILAEDSVEMKDISTHVQESASPISLIEQELEGATSIMGEMSKDAFHKVNPKEMVTYVEQAIETHKDWLSNLETIVADHVIIPLQLDHNRCGFGHFYRAIPVEDPNMQELWTEIGEMHKKVHSTAAKITQAMFGEDYSQAESLLQTVQDDANKLISDLEKVKAMCMKA